MRRPAKAKPGGHFGQQHYKRRNHSTENDGHLPFLREADRSTAAGDGVNDDEQAGKNDREVEPPAKHGRNNYRRRVNRHARSEPALHEKKSRAQQSRLSIKPSAKEFIGRVNAEPAVDGQEYGAHDNERQRQPKIILHKADAALEALSGN